MAEETSSPDDQAPNLPDKTGTDAAPPIVELEGNYFRTLIENGSDVISIHDANGRMLYQSPSIERILGYEPEELIGQTVFDYLHPDEVERIRGLYAKLINRPNKLVSAKVSFRHKDGRWRLFAVTGKNLLDNPTIKGIVFTARDITEVSLAEAALRQSEAQYRAMIEDQTELICRSLADGTLTFVNNAYSRYFNRSRNELLGRSFFQVLPDEDRQLVLNHLALITPEEPVRSLEHRVVMPDGAIRWQHWTDHAFFNEHGQLVELQSVGRDITERKLAEEELAQSLSLLQATLESTTDGILVVDRQGRITSYNHKFIEMWQIPEQVMARRDDQEALAFVMNQLKDPAETMAKVHSLYDQPLAESSDIIEFKDGRIFERYSKPQIIGHESVGRVWSFRDITGRRELEEQLRQSQKMEAIGQLAGGIAHDFNNLLTAITGYCELSLKRLTEDDPVRRNILEIQKAGGRAASLTRQLLAFSRKQILQPKILDLNQIVSEMEKMFLRLIGENIELSTRLDENLKSVRADAGQLEQVILNLVVNARDAMPGHGQLLIETANISLAETQTHRLFTIPEGDYVMLAVSDTGQGMDPQTQEKIFEPFFSTKEQGKGTGLGLSTVYGIVKQSNGYVWVESEVGEGTTFKIYLPSVAEQQQTVAPPKHSSPFSGSETLLLVEDEEIVRRMTREILEASGYTVIEATHGVEAIEICQTHQGPIHLLLTDVIMPQMSGRELAKNITRLKPEIKVLYISGYTAQDITESHGEPESGLWFLEKPFTPDSLLQRIRQVLRDNTASR